jgi:hypothetical protein
MFVSSVLTNPQRDPVGKAALISRDVYPHAFLFSVARRYFAFCRQAFEQNLAVLIPLNRLTQDWH